MIFNPLIIVLEFLNADFIELFEINLLFKLKTMHVSILFPCLLPHRQHGEIRRRLKGV